MPSSSTAATPVGEQQTDNNNSIDVIGDSSTSSHSSAPPQPTQITKPKGNRRVPKEVSRRQKMQRNMAARGVVEPPPSHVSLQVVQNGCPGMGKAVLLNATSGCYLFNCPEGLQRLAGEHSIRTGKLDHIFFTETSWTNGGGMPGMSLALEAAGQKKLTIHGPPNLPGIFDAIKLFEADICDMIIDNRPYELAEFEDHAIHVRYIPVHVRPPSTSDHEGDGGGGGGDQGVDRSSSWLLPMVMAYLVSLKPLPGKVNVQKCKALNVPLGPMLKTLKEGSPVTLPDGITVIQPSDVIEAPENSGSFLVLELPSAEYIEPFIEQFNRVMSASCQEDKNAGPLSLIVNMSSDAVLENEAFSKWLQNLRQSTPPARQLKQLIVNDGNQIVAHSQSVCGYQAVLHEISPSHFPVLYCQEAEVNTSNQQRLMSSSSTLSDGYDRLALPLLKYHLRPISVQNQYEIPEEWDIMNHSGNSITKSKEESSKRIKLAADIGENGGTPATVAEAAAEMSNLVRQSSHPRELKRFPSLNRSMSLDKYPEIYMLGTSAAIPTKYRNQSGIGLCLSKDVTAVFDCGEGIYQQLFHMFGPEVSDEFLMRLRLIFVSHLHMDHHLGLYSLVKQRGLALQRQQERMRQRGLENAAAHPLKPLYILGSTTLFSVHDSYAKLVEDFAAGQTIRRVDYDNPDEAVSAGQMKEMCTDLGLRGVEAIPVVHRLKPFGIVLDTGGHAGAAAERRIVYSGDTRPCELLAEKGVGADLLIHEATFDNAFQADAESKRHSTVEEAVQIGRKMKAKLILLTHFSGRYPKLPPIEPILLENNSDTALAFDNMRFCLSGDDSQQLPRLIPALATAFPDV